MKAPSIEVINETPHYKLLLDHASHMESALAQNTQEMTQLNETLDQLRVSRKEFEEEIQVRRQNVALSTILTSRRLQHSKRRKNSRRSCRNGTQRTFGSGNCAINMGLNCLSGKPGTRSSFNLYTS